MKKTRTRTIKSTTNSALAEKGRRLREILTGYESALIAFSGGVDSAYLAHLMAGHGLRLLAVHVDAGWNSQVAVNNIEKLVDKLGLEHDLLRLACLIGAAAAGAFAFAMIGQKLFRKASPG